VPRDLRRVFHGWRPARRLPLHRHAPLAVPVSRGLDQQRQQRQPHRQGRAGTPGARLPPKGRGTWQPHRAGRWRGGGGGGGEGAERGTERNVLPILLDCGRCANSSRSSRHYPARGERGTKASMVVRGRMRDKGRGVKGRAWGGAAQGGRADSSLFEARHEGTAGALVEALEIGRETQPDRLVHFHCEYAPAADPTSPRPPCGKASRRDKEVERAMPHAPLRPHRQGSLAWHRDITASKLFQTQPKFMRAGFPGGVDPSKTTPTY